MRQPGPGQKPEKARWPLGAEARPRQSQGRSRSRPSGQPRLRSPTSGAATRPRPLGGVRLGHGGCGGGRGAGGARGSLPPTVRRFRPQGPGGVGGPRAQAPGSDEACAAGRQPRLPRLCEQRRGKGRLSRSRGRRGSRRNRALPPRAWLHARRSRGAGGRRQGPRGHSSLPTTAGERRVPLTLRPPWRLGSTRARKRGLDEQGLLCGGTMWHGPQAHPRVARTRGSPGPARSGRM